MHHTLKKNMKNILKDDNHFLEDYVKSRLPKIHYKRAIRKRVKGNRNISNFTLDNELLYQIKRFWNKKLQLPISLDWHKIYIATNGIKDYRYIPDDVFYRNILPKLSRLDLVMAYKDKNNYNKLFPNANIPKTILRNINGNIYDEKYNSLEYNYALDVLCSGHINKMIIKPSFNSGGGRNIEVIDKKHPDNQDDRSYFIQLIKMYDKDYIIQEYVEQHDLLNIIYPHSLNTIRVMTLRYSNNIYILSSVLRLGNNGYKIDNFTLGGVACGINQKGELNEFAVNRRFEKYYSHPYTKSMFVNKYVPNFNGIKSYAKKLHKNLLYFDMVSWDIAIDKEANPILIEANLGYQGISIHQANNGSLFGELTEMILEHIL